MDHDGDVITLITYHFGVLGVVHLRNILHSLAPEGIQRCLLEGILGVHK